MTEILSWVIKLVAFFIKPRNSKWAFLIEDQHGFAGNTRALFDHIYKKESLSLVVIDARTSATHDDFADYPGIEILPHDSIKFGHIKSRLRCRVYVISHGKKALQGAFKRWAGYKTVNVWHGIPIKGMGNLDNDETTRTRRKLIKSRSQTDLFCVSSETEKAHIAGSFFLSANIIRVTGQARNDLLLMPESDLHSCHSAALRRLRNQLGDKKLVLYAPTWRDYDPDALQCVMKDIKDLSQFMLSGGAVLGVRPHPKDRQLFKRLIESCPEIIDLSNEQFEETGILLRETACLISDYSSIWVDFLLMKKPVAAFTFDMNSYMKNRGFLYHFEAIFPGPIAQTGAELINHVGRLLEVGMQEEELQRLIWSADLLHKYQDSASAERVTQAIKTIA